MSRLIQWVRDIDATLIVCGRGLIMVFRLLLWVPYKLFVLMACLCLLLAFGWEDAKEHWEQSE